LRPNKLLLIKVSDDFLDSQISFLHHFCEMMCLELSYVDVKSKEDLLYALNNQCDFTYNYIYLAGHSNEKVFGNDEMNFTWEEFANILKVASCVSDNCRLFLKSCLSSTKPVVDSIFKNCYKITTLIGFKDEVVGIDGYMATVLFLYYTEMNNVSFQNALEKINNFIPTQMEFINRQTE
jgi:hypothetical protein